MLRPLLTRINTGVTKINHASRRVRRIPLQLAMLRADNRREREPARSAWSSSSESSESSPLREIDGR